MQAMFAFLMLATTPAATLTLSEYYEFANAAGFRGAAARPLRPTPQTLIMFETWSSGRASLSGRKPRRGRRA